MNYNFLLTDGEINDLEKEEYIKEIIRNNFLSYLQTCICHSHTAHVFYEHRKHYSINNYLEQYSEAYDRILYLKYQAFLYHITRARYIQMLERKVGYDVASIIVEYL